MRPTEKKIENLIQNFNDQTRPELDENILNRCFTELDIQNSSTSKSKPNSWSIIMRKPITKFTAAAAILIAVFIGVQMTPSAYALQDTIKAYNSIRWLHVYVSDILSPQKTWTSEVWIECDSLGNTTRIRHQASSIGDSLGPLKLTNNFNESDAWLPRLNLRLLRHSSPESLLPYHISEVDPKLLFETLSEQQAQGQAVVDIQQPQEKAEPITVTVTYPQGSKSENVKKVFSIDQATNLVTRIDKFNLKDQQWQLYQTREFFDYNQPIDEKMFSLDDEVPATVKTADMTGIEIGLDQGSMTDEEITVEVTRQFFEAVIAKDYAKAGQLYLGSPDFLVEQAFMNSNVLKILSFGPVHPETDPDSNVLVCSCKVLVEFGGDYFELDASMVRVKPVPDHPGKWMICGTSTSFMPASGSLTLSQEKADLSAATYDGLLPGEFMQKWLLLEPMRIEVRGDTLFPSDETQKIEFDADQIDTAQFKPTVTIGQKEYQWSLLQNDYGVIDLGKVDENWYLITYAWAQVDMPEEKQAVLGIGSDDCVKVWLNGELVHENYTSRGVGIDNDCVPVTFKKGTNRLVLKIQNGGGPWGFCCRLLEK